MLKFMRIFSHDLCFILCAVCEVTDVHVYSLRKHKDSKLVDALRVEGNMFLLSSIDRDTGSAQRVCVCGMGKGVVFIKPGLTL